MTMKQQLLRDLHDLSLERRAVSFMHDRLAQISEDVKNLPPEKQEDLNREYDDLLRYMIATVNHISALEKLLFQLTPEEQLVIERMFVDSYRNCSLDLSAALHCDVSTVYRVRARALHKLGRLRFGSEWKD